AERASELLSDCAQSIERLGDAEAWVKSRFHYARATHRSCTGMLAGALADVTAAAALAAQAGDASLAGLARNGVGKLLVELGMAERAVVVLEDVLTEARA